MENKELIEKLARKLNRFTLADITMVSELEENEVQDLVNELITENIIVQKDDFYLFLSLKNKKQNNCYYPIILEKEPEYEEYLKLPEYAKRIVQKHIQVYNLTHNLRGKDVRNALKLSGIKCAYSTALVHNKRYRYIGLKGLFPKYFKHQSSLIPDKFYEVFKKYYLTSDKFTIKKAAEFAKKEINRKNEIKYDYNFSDKSLLLRLKNDMSQVVIDRMRDTIPKLVLKKTEKEIRYDKKCEMLFTDAAKHYFNKLKKEHKMEKLANQKTSYKRHLLPFFENYKIGDITRETLAEFKERQFNDGYNLSSVSTYLSLVKEIIRNVSLDFKDFATKNKREMRYDFIEMHLFKKDKIKRILMFLKNKYPEAYPIIKISLLTGANIPEILALTWKDVNLQEKYFHINKFLYLDKCTYVRDGFVCRDLFFDDEIAEILSNKKDNQKPTDFVFRFKTKMFQQVYFEKKFLPVIKKRYNIEKLLVSDFVHNFVNLLIEQNVPVTYISRQRGMHIKNFICMYEKLIKEKELLKYNSLK